MHFYTHALNLYNIKVIISISYKRYNTKFDYGAYMYSHVSNNIIHNVMYFHGRVSHGVQRVLS